MKRTVSEGQIHGAEELSAHLKTLGDKFEKRVLRTATLAGAKYFRDVVLRKVRRLDMKATGRRRLRQAIQIARPRYWKRSGKLTAGVHIASMPRVKKGKHGKDNKINDPKVWWRWIEGGTGERYRRGRSKAARVARAVTGSKKGFTGSIKAQPFLEPTFLEESDGALHAVIADARKRTEKALARAAKGKRP